MHKSKTVCGNNGPQARETVCGFKAYQNPKRTDLPDKVTGYVLHILKEEKQFCPKAFLRVTFFSAQLYGIKSAGHHMLIWRRVLTYLRLAVQIKSRFPSESKSSPRLPHYYPPQRTTHGQADYTKCRAARTDRAKKTQN